MYTLSNDFHGTVARVRSLDLSAATAARIRRKLCGHPGCACGMDDLKQRGPRDWHALADPNTGRIHLSPRD